VETTVCHRTTRELGRNTRVRPSQSSINPIRQMIGILYLILVFLIGFLFGICFLIVAIPVIVLWASSHPITNGVLAPFGLSIAQGQSIIQGPAALKASYFPTRASRPVHVHSSPDASTPPIRSLPTPPGQYANSHSKCSTVAPPPAFVPNAPRQFTGKLQPSNVESSLCQAGVVPGSNADEPTPPLPVVESRVTTTNKHRRLEAIAIAKEMMKTDKDRVQSIRRRRLKDLS
jgi:hypothetical protein